MSQVEVRSDKSTNVRSGAPAPLRLALAALGSVAPSLAARAGARLFLSPRRHTLRGPRDHLDGAETFLVRSGREVLRAWRLGEGPPVLLVHGWGGRAEQLAPFVAPLRAAGCAPVLFDAPAHGASTGRLTSGLGFAEAVSSVAAAVGARAAIAHSLGATGLAWALASGLDLDAAVLVAPPRGPVDFFHRFCEALALRPGVRDATRARLERRLGIDLDDFDLSRRVGAGPVLVIHDRYDREVPWSDGLAIAQAWPRASFLSTSGLGHRRILRDGTVTARAAAFVSERLTRCDCGRPAAGAGLCPQCALERELFHAPSRWPRA
jgi:pimeloyl-ACP methyl ester carboxylesterase